MNPNTSIVPIDHIAAFIALVRRQRVILDSDLARLYGVEIKRLNEQYRRNIARFPEDFAFQLAPHEWTSLRSQFATLEIGRGRHRKYRPVVFTEHGALMAANILNSPRAVAMSIHVIRAFIQFRQVLATHSDLARKLATLEKKYNSQFKVVFDAIRQLMEPPPKPRREIGFHSVKK